MERRTGQSLGGLLARDRELDVRVSVVVDDHMPMQFGGEDAVRVIGADIDGLFDHDRYPMTVFEFAGAEVAVNHLRS